MTYRLPTAPDGLIALGSILAIRLGGGIGLIGRRRSEPRWLIDRDAQFRRI